jgi:hypothetical protein
VNTRSIAPQRLPQDAANLEPGLACAWCGPVRAQRHAGHDVSERLRVAREQALARAREARAALPAGARKPAA